ncbi:hypothetical protein F6A46_11325 [Tenacibaculum finnmarkense genomovar ulcerans]|uniref:hypothetical protein n=1 Tax=Tenacibaculum finnmarkense TaxID=2781243 RepID=UPI00187B5367|nr:hypothetical protein [Tenacibaculum finnmarkense]MBE7688813.1 hypothetical protein [Tenacibaculum finnmarkense genomovar ulcerans]
MKINIIKTIAISFLLFVSCSVVSEASEEDQKITRTTTLNNTIRDVSDVNIGFNRRSNSGSWWTDNSFINLVEEINPDIMRYPGGTQANYWDWRTGKFLSDTDKNWGTKEVLKIPQFINALPSRTKIIYVVNMARPTPLTGIDVNATQAVLKSDATLNLKISDMISAIDKFVSEGKEPYAVELGNEFYFGNEEGAIYHITQKNGLFYSGWNTSKNQPYQSTSKKDATDINALFYLKHAKKIVEKIKIKYPKMKFALTTTKSGNGTSVRDRWNNTIFDNLNSNPEFSTLKKDIYAVTQHHYLSTNYGVQTPISNELSSKTAIAEGIKYPIEKQADYQIVPNDFKIWYTEYGETKGIAEETWADAVRYAALTYSWLSLGDKVNQLDFHYVSDNTVIKVASPMVLAPVGIAAKQFMLAAAEMTEMQQINFDFNPISVNGVLSLYGYKFKNARKETLLILNLNKNDIKNVTFDNLLSYKGTPILTQYYSASPWVSSVTLGDENIIFNNETITTSFNARNFSITVIEVQN